MAKNSANRAVSQRILRLRKTVKINTQKIRSKTLKYLEEIFDLSVSIAKGEVQRQRRSDGKEIPITLQQRQKWARIAAHTAQIINSVASGFDERQIDVQLDELERLVSEAKAKTKDGKSEERVAETGGDRGSDT